METKNLSTLDKNKLIAEFLGWEFTPPSENIPQAPNGIWTDPTTGIGQYTLHFHSSWSHIMDALSKINLLGNGYASETTSSLTVSGQWIKHRIAIKESSFANKLIVEGSSDYQKGESKIELYHRVIADFINNLHGGVE